MRRKVFTILIVLLMGMLLGGIIQDQYSKRMAARDARDEVERNIISLVDCTTQFMNSVDTDRTNYLVSRDKYMQFVGEFNDSFSENSKLLKLDKQYPDAVLILSDIKTFADRLPLNYEDFSTDDKWVACVQLVNTVLWDRRNDAWDRNDDSLARKLDYLNNDARIKDLCTQLRQERTVR